MKEIIPVVFYYSGWLLFVAIFLCYTCLKQANGKGVGNEAMFFLWSVIFANIVFWVVLISGFITIGIRIAQ